jgi:copper(I)-binding protein
MADLRKALKQLGPDANRVSVAFVTVDPERDTAPVVSPYVTSFIAGAHALRTEDPAALKQAQVARHHRHPLRTPSPEGDPMRSNHRFPAGAAIALAVLTAAGCGSSSTSSTGATGTSAPATTGTASTAKPAVTVGDPWARTSPAAVNNGAAYMTLTSNVGDTLVKASVPTSVAATTEIHETVIGGSTGSTGMSGSTGSTAMASTTTMPTASSTTTAMMGDTGTTAAGGMASGEMGMRPIPSLDLPAGQTVTLKPGGYHIMMIDLVKPLTTGDQVVITLTFAKAGEQQVTAVVRDA